jgi:protein tyrosine/serine phosphatase
VRNYFFAFLFVAIWTSGANAKPDHGKGKAKSVTHGIPNLQTTNGKILRGGRPDLPQGIQYLDSSGVSLIINLDNEDEFVTAELNEVANHSAMTEFESPMSFLDAPTDQEIDTLLAKLRSNVRGKIFIHCKHGEDRTGLVIGLYRVEVEGWAPRDAYREMLDLGFHPFLHALDSYFRKRTGMH